MNVAVIGSEGYIAGYLKECFTRLGDIDSIIGIDKVQIPNVIYLDLEKPDEFEYEIFDSIDFVIFTAAISSPDLCAQHQDWCWKINVTGTEYVIEQVIKRGKAVLFFSSDAVYGQDDGGIKNEHSNKNPYTPYGIMKNHVEDRFQNNTLFKAIRLSYVASGRDKFVKYCLGCMRNNEEAEIFHPFYRNCITIQDVLDAVCWLLKNWDVYLPGSFNVAGSELVSRVRMADEINRICGNRLQYRVVSPGAVFFQNRPAVMQMQSMYNHQYNILKESSFSEKFKKELGGSIL